MSSVSNTPQVYKVLNVKSKQITKCKKSPAATKNWMKKFERLSIRTPNVEEIQFNKIHKVEALCFESNETKSTRMSSECVESPVMMIGQDIQVPPHYQGQFCFEFLNNINSDILAHQTLENSNCLDAAASSFTGFLGNLPTQFVNTTGVTFDDDNFDMDLLDALM
eukprot:403365453